MSLALRLGRTLHELRQTLTASELKMWIEYDRISPIGGAAMLRQRKWLSPH